MEMIHLHRNLAGIAAFFIASTCAFAGSDWTGYAQILELTATSQGRYLVQLNVSDNPSGCQNKDTFYQDYGTAGSDNMYRALLEAVGSDKKVRVYVTGRCGFGGYAEISSVGVVP
jgi:hypothetical protein